MDHEKSTSHHIMSSLNFPRQLSISLNPNRITVIKGSRDHTIDIPRPITGGESSQKQPPNFQVVGIASSSSKELEEGALEAALEAELRKDPNSEKIAHLQELVTRLRLEVQHYQKRSYFYKGEAEHAMETLSSVKMKVSRIAKFIRFRE
ncbi:hypothetical protein AMTR_s00114p00116720 [Amborella trichopoda]|uniref:Uncharacterized protein n=1 Tax=Amborella trichopoda TaxID=13333 RepID=W1NW68_AMBTC|nr:hypothetical protein AMTR_s00114p00116720 [Amborella trichopoda]